MEEWRCPSDILCGVRGAIFMEGLSDTEKQHIPLIECPAIVSRDVSFEVRISVGQAEEHPSEPDHFVEWVELYAGDTFLGKSHFSGGSSFPVAVFKVKLSHGENILKAWAKCNMYGLWKNEKPLVVK
jgi:superoxide reductase